MPRSGRRARFNWSEINEPSLRLRLALQEDAGLLRGRDGQIRASVIVYVSGRNLNSTSGFSRGRPLQPVSSRVGAAPPACRTRATCRPCAWQSRIPVSIVGQPQCRPLDARIATRECPRGPWVCARLLSLREGQRKGRPQLKVADKFGNRVDLLIGLRGLDPLAFSRLSEISSRGQELQFIGREDFIAMKVFAGDPLDLADAARAVLAAGTSLDVDMVRRLATGSAKTRRGH